jgi:hypothetical protein
VEWKVVCWWTKNGARGEKRIDTFFDRRRRNYLTHPLVQITVKSEI